MKNKDLIDEAIKIVGSFKASESSTIAGVASALEANDGSFHTGVCIDNACGIGTCAEHAAIADLVKTKNTKIKRIVAVDESGAILPPCGRCRELIFQINHDNVDTKIILDQDKEMTLEELLPVRWQKNAKQLYRYK